LWRHSWPPWRPRASFGYGDVVLAPDIVFLNLGGGGEVELGKGALLRGDHQPADNEGGQGPHRHVVLEIGGDHSRVKRVDVDLLAGHTAGELGGKHDYGQLALRGGEVPVYGPLLGQVGKRQFHEGHEPVRMSSH